MQNKKEDVNIEELYGEYSATQSSEFVNTYKISDKRFIRFFYSTKL